MSQPVNLNEPSHDAQASLVAQSSTNAEPPQLTPSNNTFPVQLHFLLTEFEADYQHLVSWCPHGRAFIVHKVEAFVEQVLKR
jgi:HSF-type DNA-binding